MLAMINLLIEIRLPGVKSILFIVLGLLVSCAANRHPKSNMGVVLGKVTYEKGNQMPGQDSSASAKGVIRDIYIYELTNELDVSKKNLLYTDINSKVITKVSSDASGAFSIELMEGEYSLLIKEGDAYYASQLDMNNNLHPITVKAGETTRVNVLINYEAFY